MKTLKSKGFTLIELMIVVAIIGILAAIAIPKFGAMQVRARESATMGNLGAIRSAISIHYGDKEYYPGNNPASADTPITDLSPTYLPAVQNAPSLGRIAIPLNQGLSGSGGTCDVTTKMGAGTIYDNVNAETSVVKVTSVTFSAITSATPLVYAKSDGTIAVNDVCKDYTGAAWWTK